MRGGPIPASGWPPDDLDEQRFSPLDQINDQQRRPARPRLVRRPRHRPRHGSDAARRRRRALHHHRLEHRHAPTTRKTGKRAVDATIRKVDRAQWAGCACCDVVNRGVAVWKGKVYRRHARRPADRARRARPASRCGRCRPSTPPSPTRSPARRASSKGKVLIGNGGAEYGVRGYVPPTTPRPASRLWRFYTVPGDPGRRRLRDTGDGDGRARPGPASGGSSAAAARCGTRSPTIPSSTCVYVGTGNGSPWNAAIPQPRRRRQPVPRPRSSRSNADTGEYVWHYQTTPGESWDYTATQPIMLADLTIDGAAAQGADAGAEERLLLRARPRDRQADLGQELSCRSTGRPAST